MSPLDALRRGSTPGATFDAWLQRGVLCHAFHVDPGLLRFTVKLAAPLPHGGPAHDALRALGFDAHAHVAAARFRYLEDPRAVEPEARHHEKWKGRFFVETNLGHWCSRESVDAWREEAHGPGAPLRHAELDALRYATEIQRNLWIDTLLGQLRRAVSALGDAAPRVLLFTGDHVDIRGYRAAAEEQLARDARRARTPAFRERYTTGFEFSVVPPFRNTGLPWTRFARSLAERLTCELARPVVHNRLARMVQRLAPRDALDSEALLRWLRDGWTEHHTALSRYHLAD
jgi:hypothetical protein